MKLLDNDRLSLWFAGPVLAWLLSLVLYVPVFHSWLGVPLSTIGISVAICCVVHLAAVPFLYSARRTAERPSGLIWRRTATVFVWFGATFVSLFLYWQSLWPHTANADLFRLVLLITLIGFWILLALITFIFRKQFESLIESFNVNGGTGSHG